MALTVSSIEADFVKDTKTIGKQSAYLDFDFGGRVHSTDVLKSAGKFATWDTPVQLTGAGITMKVIAKASKTLAHDKALGVGELNLLKAAGQGPQTVQLRNELTGSYAGEVRLTISGGSPAISGLPHTEGHGIAGAAESALPGHHGSTTTGSSTQGGHGGAIGGAGAGAGAAGLGAAALHHHNQGEQGVTSQQGGLTKQQGGTTGRQHETLGQSVEDRLPGHHGRQGGISSQQGGIGHQGGGIGQQHEMLGQRVEDRLPGHHSHDNQAPGGVAGGAGAAGLGAAALHHRNQGEQQGVTGGQQRETLGQRIEDRLPGHHTHNQQGVAGQTGAKDVPGQQQGQDIGQQQGIGGGIGGGGSGNSRDSNACPQCHGTGGLAQRMEQGLGIGGGQQQQGGQNFQQGTY